MKRIWPSFISVSFLNVSRHTLGTANGNRPSITNISAKAVNQESDIPTLLGRDSSDI